MNTREPQVTAYHSTGQTCVGQTDQTMRVVIAMFVRPQKGWILRLIRNSACFISRRCAERRDVLSCNSLQRETSQGERRGRQVAGGKGKPGGKGGGGVECGGEEWGGGKVVSPLASRRGTNSRCPQGKFSLWIAL